MKLEEKLVLKALWEKIKKCLATKLHVAMLKYSKQDTLIAGKGIRIVNDVISNSLFPYKYKNDQGQWVIQGPDEKVIVTLFGPPGFNLANRAIVLTYYLDNEPVLPARVITKNTDSNGVVIFSSDPNDLVGNEEKTGVPVGYEYEITFPKIDTYLEITPEKHVAGVVERNIEVSYVPLLQPEDDDYGEEITIHLDKFKDNTVTPFGGVNVSVKIGTDNPTTYTTNANNGNTISFKVRYGLSYTVTVPTMTDYYIPAAAYTLTYTSEKRHRHISFIYKFIKVGIFIVDKNGKEYTSDEWIDARDGEDVNELDRVVNEDAILLKIVNSTLAAHNGIFGVDINNLRLRNYVSGKWANVDVLFTSIPATTTQNANTLYYYDGYTASSLIRKEANTRIIGLPAIGTCLSNIKSVVQNEITLNYNGFLGSPGLWQTIWNNRNTINDLLDIVRPTTEKPDGVTYYQFSNLTTGKWTSGLSGSGRACYFTSSLLAATSNQNQMTSSYAIIPFFTC